MNCPHYDYGKTAPVEYGIYCHSKKQFVEPEDCEACDYAKGYSDGYYEALNVLRIPMGLKVIDKEKKEILAGSF